MKNDTYHVIMIEDNETFSLGIENLLKHNPLFTWGGRFSNPKNGLAYIAKHKVDIVLMDINLPEMNGIEATGKVKSISPETDVVIVTIFENSHKVFDALCAGASGYITKNSPVGRIEQSLMEIIQGGSPMSSHIARMVVDSFQMNHSSPLSERETTVLKSLSDGKTYSMIADELFISKETVKSHIKQIYSKLEVHSKSEAIAKAKDKKYL